jgi:hypothetical protein
MLISPHSTDVSSAARRYNDKKYDIPAAQSAHIFFQVRVGG